MRTTWNEGYMKQGLLPRKLRLLRADLGLTLREVTERTGVAKETLSDIERGLRHPHDATLAKLARGYNVSLEDLLDLKEADETEEEEASVLVKAQAPPDAQTSERSLSYVNAWATFVDEFAGDLEEWKYQQTAGALDPADLPEDEFVPFIFSAMLFVKTYQRIHQAVYADDGLLSLLEEEVRFRGGRKDQEIERFERAFRRLSRAMLSVVTERVAQRVNQLAEAEKRRNVPETKRKVPNNVSDLFQKGSDAANAALEEAA